MTLRRTAAVVCILALGAIVNAAPTAAAPPKGAPKAPTNLRITASTSTSVTLAWDASSANSSNWWYCVQNGGTGCIRVNPPQTTLTRTQLLPDRTFSFSVYAINSAGNRSASSNTVTFTTPPDTTPPSPPPTLSLTAVHPVRISVAWTASTDNLSQVWYSLFMNNAPVVENSIGLGSATLLYLTPSTTYVFKVTARDASGNTVTSNVLSVTTPAATDAVAATVPTNIVLSPETSSPEIWLDWSPSTDNVDPQSLILYEIYQNGVLTTDGGIGAPEGITFCRFTGPIEVVLRAVDTSGNRSGPSSALMFVC